MTEFENPTRRYRNFRPRQMMISALQPGAPTNFGTHSIFNDSLGEYYLVIRDFRGLMANGLNFQGSILQGSFGSNQGAKGPLVGGSALLPGQHFYADIAAQTNPIYKFANVGNVVSHAVDLPLAVLPPGWSFVLQAATAAVVFTCNFVWEAIFPDELDYMF